MSDRPLTLGTAGHIDHGKTALIARLTGVDTDRLPEEKARGISIELGYAPLRAGEPPVVAVVRDGRTLLDCRTLTDAEAGDVARAVAAARDA